MTKAALYVPEIDKHVRTYIMDLSNEQTTIDWNFIFERAAQYGSPRKVVFMCKYDIDIAVKMFGDLMDSNHVVRSAFGTFHFIADETAKPNTAYIVDPAVRYSEVENNEKHFVVVRNMR